MVTTIRVKKETVEKLRTILPIGSLDDILNYILDVKEGKIKPVNIESNIEAIIKHDEYVYFLAADNNLVKISKTVDIERRVREIMNISPIKLELLSYTNKISENDIHKKFAHLRHHLEWYALSTELMEFIKNTKDENFKDFTKEQKSEKVENTEQEKAEIEDFLNKMKASPLMEPYLQRAIENPKKYMKLYQHLL